MLRTLVPCVALSLLLSCNNNAAKSVSSTNPNAVLTKEMKREGWKLLFDGETTNGWHKYGGGPIDSVWKVTDGMLFLDMAGKKAMGVKGDWDIVTDEEYDNFHFRLEWKVAPKGNSGIIFYIHEDRQKYRWPWETGPEMQVLDNQGHPDAKHKTHRAGDLYDLLSCSEEVVKPAGEWNLAEVKCVEGKLDLYLNGVNVVSTRMWDDNWKKMVAGSKFRSMPDFGTYKKGRIGLQDHGDDVWYRNIMIRKL